MTRPRRSDTPSGRPELKVDVEAATKVLRALITKGEALRQREIGSENELQRSRADMSSWEAEVEDVLGRLFSTDAIGIEFSEASGGLDRVVSGLDEKVESHHLRLDAKVNHVVALVERLQTIASLAPRSTPTPGRMADPKRDTRAVFVVHGRDGDARDALFDFLRALDLRPMEWEEHVRRTGKGAPYIAEIIEAGFAAAQAVVVLLTGDDEARLRADLGNGGAAPERLTRQPRQNVLIEAGMALQQGRDRAVLIRVGELRRITDIDGIHILPFNANPDARKDIAERLKTVGCSVSTTANDWLRAGRVPDAPRPSAPGAEEILTAPPLLASARAAVRLPSTGCRPKLSIVIRLGGSARLPDLKLERVHVRVQWRPAAIDTQFRHFDTVHNPIDADGELGIRKEWLLTPDDVASITRRDYFTAVALDGKIVTNRGEVSCDLAPVAIENGHLWNSTDSDTP